MIELRIIDRSLRKVISINCSSYIFGTCMFTWAKRKLSLGKSDERRCMARATGFIHRLHTECYFCCTFPAGRRVIRSVP